MDACRARSLAVALAACLAGAGACRGERGTDAPLTVRDSAGVVLVELGERVLDSLPQWSLDSGALSIGTLDGPPEYQLNHAASPWQLSDGRIVVANNESEIRYYDRTGRHLRTVGRKGGGPGEYRWLWNIHPLRGDSLLAFDVRATVSILGPSGRFARSYAFPPRAQGDLFEWLPDRRAGFYQDDIAKAIRHARSADAMVQSKAFLVIADTAGLVLDTLDTLPGYWLWVTEFTNYGELWYAGRPLLAAGSGTVVAAHGDVLVLRWYRLPGGLSRVARVRAQRHSVGRSDVERAQAELIELTKGRPLNRPLAALLTQPHAKYLPLTTQLRLDRSERVWVRRWAYDDAPQAPWVIFDSTGRPLARLTMPGAFRPNDIGDDYVLGVLQNPGFLDVVVRYRLRRTQAGGNGAH